jgi:IS30 family transposase
LNEEDLLRPTQAALQRGARENTIGSLHQYPPKYRDLEKFTASRLYAIGQQPNHRPGKYLGYLAPREILFNKTPVASRT